MPGVRVRHDEEKAAMRNMILEAATQIILADGYENLSMRKLAAAIGYSPTTIYIYYKDKHAIVHDISMQLYEEMFAQLQIYLQESPQVPPAQRLSETFKLFVRTMTGRPDMERALWSSAINPLSALNEIQQREGNAMALLQQLLQEGQAQQVFRPLSDDAPWMLQTSLMGFTSFAVMNRIYQRQDWEQVLEDYVNTLLRGVLAE